MITPNELGKRIKDIREWKRMSQNELGRALANVLEQSTVSEIERGNRRITVYELLDIARVLEVHPYKHLLDENAVSPDDDEEYQQERMVSLLIKHFEQLPDELQVSVLNLVMTIAQRSNMERLE